MWAIIGGSGFEKSEAVSALEELDRRTPFGDASSGLKRVKVGAKEALFLPRHGLTHELLPSEVNFRANIFALKKHGATRILAFSAVGSLRADLKPGMLAIPTQYIDRTKSLRKTSFYGEGIVGHVSLAHPVCPSCVQMAMKLSQAVKLEAASGVTSLTIEGPYFSTQAESKSYRGMGADIITMTAFPEFALAREAGLCYLPCSFVTDFDCWDDSIPHVTIQEVFEVMRANNLKAYRLAQAVLDAAPPAPCACATNGLASGLVTSWEHIPATAKSWLEVLGVRQVVEGR